MLHYSYPQVVIQEVPDEIALALSISGCSLNCNGCHSTETFNSTFGSPLTPEHLQELITKNVHISCVLFYGGEWESKELLKLFKVVKTNNLKLALYTGLEFEKVPFILYPLLDYIKVGPYIKALGGLEAPTTNQHLITFKENNENRKNMPKRRDNSSGITGVSWDKANNK
jgi:anaerobic ribonucleoside-triphosphate reductase activating protein